LQSICFDFGWFVFSEVLLVKLACSLLGSAEASDVNINNNDVVTVIPALINLIFITILFYCVNASKQYVLIGEYIRHSLGIY
jgi:hypothetical protein